MTKIAERERLRAFAQIRFVLLHSRLFTCNAAMSKERTRGAFFFALLLTWTLEENLGAVNVELTSEDLREIDEAASEIDVQGARYPEKLEAMTGR